MYVERNLSIIRKKTRSLLLNFVVPVTR